MQLRQPSLSEAEPRRERSCPTHHLGDPGPEEAGQGEVHLSSLYLFFLSRSLRRELRPPPSQSDTKCKIFYPKRKVQRTLAAVMSFPYDSKPLGSSLGQPSSHSKASCFLFFSRLEPQLRIAPHSCCCVHVLLTCRFLLYMHETLFLYLLQGK